MPSITRRATPKWRRLPEARPQQILDAAFQVFGEHGLAGARLEDIAKRAGVAKGTIYLYFPHKEALFQEMIRQTIIAHLERTEREFVEDTGSTATAQLRNYMRELWTVARSPAYQVVMRLVIAELHRFPDLVEFYWREVVVRKQQLLDGVIRRGISQGEFRVIDPRVAGRMMASMFAMHALWVTGPCAPVFAAESTEALFEQLTDFFFHAVAPVGVPPTGRDATPCMPPLS